MDISLAYPPCPSPLSRTDTVRNSAPRLLAWGGGGGVMRAAAGRHGGCRRGAACRGGDRHRQTQRLLGRRQPVPPAPPPPPACQRRGQWRPARARHRWRPGLQARRGRRPRAGAAGQAGGHLTAQRALLTPSSRGSIHSQQLSTALTQAPPPLWEYPAHPTPRRTRHAAADDQHLGGRHAPRRRDLAGEEAAKVLGRLHHGAAPRRWVWVRV